MDEKEFQDVLLNLKKPSFFSKVFKTKKYKEYFEVLHKARTIFEKKHEIIGLMFIFSKPIDSFNSDMYDPRIWDVKTVTSIIVDRISLINYLSGSSTPNLSYFELRIECITEDFLKCYFYINIREDEMLGTVSYLTMQRLAFLNNANCTMVNINND